MSMPDFVGDQTPKSFDEHSAVYFWHRLRTQGGIAAPQLRVPLASVKKYRNIEDILSDVKLIPLETKKYSIRELQDHIRNDALVGFSPVFYDWNIIAHCGTAVQDKPIAFVNDPNGAYYVAHPQASKYIKRLDPSDFKGTV